eukprot:1525786-Alexandrium_andersonii.AAC.1
MHTTGFNPQEASGRKREDTHCTVPVPLCCAVQHLRLALRSRRTLCFAVSLFRPCLLAATTPAKSVAKPC